MSLPPSSSCSSDQTNRSTAFLLPGTGYTAQAPLLYWAAEALNEAGYSVVVISWEGDPTATSDPDGYVARHIETAVEEHGTPTLIIGKSFGTLALPYAVASDIAGIWLTPVLTHDLINDALQNASSQHLAIGGTADPMWEPAGDLVTQAGCVAIPDADHSLLIPGAPWRTNFSLHEMILHQVNDHLDRLLTKKQPCEE